MRKTIYAYCQDWSKDLDISELDKQISPMNIESLSFNIKHSY